MTGENAHMLYLLLQSVNILGIVGYCEHNTDKQTLSVEVFYVPLHQQLVKSFCYSNMCMLLYNN